MSSSNQPSFEASFANDVNGAAFKNLIKNTNNNTNNSSHDDKKQNQHQQQQSNMVKIDPASEGMDQSSPEDLNLFITDLLEQMVSL